MIELPPGVQVIRMGMKNRHVGSHDLNMESSRSHSLMTLHCTATPTDEAAWDYGTTRFGKICFVDLAGSERLKDSKSEGVMLRETANINKSLFALGK
ncbi:kinesin-like protein, partial [Haematococcus lacustris]